MQLLLGVGSGADKDAGTLGLLFWEADWARFRERLFRWRRNLPFC